MDTLIDYYIEIKSGKRKKFPKGVFVDTSENNKQEYIDLLRHILDTEHLSIDDITYEKTKELGIVHGLNKLFHSSIPILKYYYYDKSEDNPPYLYGMLPSSYWTKEKVKEAVLYYLKKEYNTDSLDIVNCDFLCSHHLYNPVRIAFDGGGINELLKYMSPTNYSIYFKRALYNKEEAVTKIKHVMDKNNLDKDSLTARWMMYNGLSFFYINMFHCSIDEVKEVL